MTVKTRGLISGVYQAHSFAPHDYGIIDLTLERSNNALKPGEEARQNYNMVATEPYSGDCRMIGWLLTLLSSLGPLMGTKQAPEASWVSFSL